MLPKAESGKSHAKAQRPTSRWPEPGNLEQKHTKGNEERVAAAGLWLERSREISGLLSCEDCEECVHRSGKCPHRAVSCDLRRAGSAHIDSAKFGGKGCERHADSEWILGPGHL